MQADTFILLKHVYSKVTIMSLNNVSFFVVVWEGGGGEMNFISSQCR